MLRLLASTEIELYLIMCCLRLYDCYSGEPVICVKIMVISVKDPYFLSFSYGFGLPACKAYVEKLGGTLHIESMQVRDKKLPHRLSV